MRASAVCAALLALACGGCQTTARSTRPAHADDVDRAVTLPRTLPSVWFRRDGLPAPGIPQDDIGTLFVGSDAILYNSESANFNIPTRAIRSVSWRTLDGDRENEWAVITWREGGTDQLVGFAAADGYLYQTSNKELYSAIVVAREAQLRR